MSLDLQERDEGVVLRVRAVPGAQREGILGPYAGALKLSTSAPADKGRANRRLLDLLAAALGIPRRELELVSGAAAREKRVLIRRLSPDELRRRLRPYLS